MTLDDHFPGIFGNRPVQLGIGIILGIAFGFCLQKGGVSHYDVILGQLLLVDFTVFKLMFTAIIVGAVGVYVMEFLKLVRLHTWRAPLRGVIVGGLIFGAGFATLGYCPGGVMAALGQGSLDALFGIAGILAGVWTYACAYPRIAGSCLAGNEIQRVTFPEALGVSPFIIIIPLDILVVVMFSVLGSMGY